MIELKTYKYNNNPFQNRGYNLLFTQLINEDQAKKLIEWNNKNKKQVGKFYKYVFTYDRKTYELFTAIFYLPNYIDTWETNRGKIHSI